MKSSNINLTPPVVSEKCSTPHCMKAQVRCSHLLRYGKILCLKFYFTAGICQLKKGKKMWKLTPNDSSKSVHKTYLEHAKPSLLSLKPEARPWHWLQEHCKGFGCYSTISLLLQSLNMSLKTHSRNKLWPTVTCLKHNVKIKYRVTKLTFLNLLWSPMYPTGIFILESLGRA